ncbi:MAG: transposase [Armatimonadota bacterium]
MSQSLSQVIVHGVFSTKHRTPWLDAELRESLFAYISTLLKSQGHVPIIVGGHDDHIHMLFGLARTVSVSDTMKLTKVHSSLWVKQEFENRKDFGWQSGYGAFSVAYSSMDAAIAYIANQDDHHSKTSFQDEFRSLMKEHGIEIDEKYVWD